MITGSLLGTCTDYELFNALLTTAHQTHVVNLLVSPAVRQQRRSTRAKQTTQEWRDRVDRVDIVDTTFRDAHDEFHYIEIDNSQQRVPATIAVIQTAIPEIGPATQP